MDAAIELARVLGTGRPRRLIVAFSGGRDSTALLHAAVHAGGTECLALHVDHGLHPDSDAWRRHCEATAARFGAAFEAVRVEVGSGNREAAARDARHREFAGRTGAGDWLLLAHHADDQIETMLQRLASGRGFLPMPVTRPVGGGLLVRPWLELPAAAIAAYADHHGLAAVPGWIEDPANDDTGLDRNFLRHAVVPMLRGRWPAIDAAFTRAVHADAARTRLVRALIDREPAFDFGHLFAIGLDDRAVAAGLRVWLDARGGAGLADRQLAEFVRQCRTGGGQPRLELPGDDPPGATLWAWRGKAERVVPVAAPPAPIEGCVPQPVELAHGILRFEPATAGLTAGAFELKFPAGGERLATPAGRTSVKELLRARGIAPWRRATYPLLYRSGQLVALPGIAVEPGARDGSNLFWPNWIFR
jgi:tRNA(Ile)-lysidine synthase